MAAQKKYDIFISWANDDNGIGNAIAKECKKYIETIFDKRVSAFVSDVDISNVWTENLKEALSEAEWMIVILTPQAVDSLWVNYEYGCMPHPKNIRVFKFGKLDKSKSPLGHHQLLDFSEQQFKKFLFEVLKAKVDGLDELGVFNSISDKIKLKVPDLCDTLEKLASKIDNLYIRNYRLRNEMVAKIKGIASQEKEIEELKDENDKCKKEIDEKQKDNNAQKDQIDILKHERDSYDRENKTLKSEIEGFKTGKKYKRAKRLCAILFALLLLCLILIPFLKNSYDNKIVVYEDSLSTLKTDVNRLQLAYESTIADIDAISKAYADSLTVEREKNRKTPVVSIPRNEPNKEISEANSRVDLGLRTKNGKKIYWAACNLGAEHPWQYGNYYAWGETTPKTTKFSWTNYKYSNGQYNVKKYCGNSQYGRKDNLTILQTSDDAATALRKNGWRMPTSQELSDLKNKCKWKWVSSYKGHKVNGYVVSGNGNEIFLPAAGYKQEGSNYEGSRGYYWTSSLYTIEPYLAFDLRFSQSNSGQSTNNYFRRYYGLSIRPVYVE